jgi:hypothetical protein
MAGISQKVSQEEVIPLLSRNVFLLGYEGSQTRVRPTEFLILLSRYVQQARELTVLAGADGTLRVANCEQARPLLQILGYRTRADCGQASTFLETADAQRAFLTIDSGFPLPALEKTLQGGPAFSYTFTGARVPILFTENDWTSGKNLLDAVIRDPGLARLYWAISRMDPETQATVAQSPGLRKLAAYAPALDFYGAHLRIRSGHVIVPGGHAAESAWKELVGANPDNPGEFVLHLFSKDNAWLAAYYDAVSRINKVQQARFTEPNELRRYYEALRRQDVPSPTDAARSVFRPAPGLLLLLTRLQFDANGQPHVPGNLEVWKRAISQKPYADISHELAKRARRWDSAGQMIETMFAYSRAETDSGPLQVYLTLSELDAARTAKHRLSPETVSLLINRFGRYSDQYLIFSEFPELDDASITSFLSVAEHLTNIPNHYVRGNALGAFQACVGLWQILARQDEIPDAQLNASWQKIVKSFAQVNSSADVFDAGRSSIRELFVASSGRPEGSEQELIDLLAGPRQSTPEGQQVHQELASRIRTALDGQRLVSLDTLLTLGDGLRDPAQLKANSSRLASLAGETREFQMPQPIFKNSERDEWGAGIYNNRHTDLEMRTDLPKAITTASTPEQLAQARGQLASFLRDSLVGLNYAYYEPPGAQILLHNPLFVRSHDFSGDTVVGMQKACWKAPQLFGAGSPAGGGAHLVGSLADLPYVLAEAEQDFITPENVQALIWGAVVPGLLTSAVVPRWWGVSHDELHAVSLYQQAGEELLASAAKEPDLRDPVVDILSDRMLPQTAERVAQALKSGSVSDILPRLTPADTFYLAAQFRQQYPDKREALGEAGKDLDALLAQHPDEVSWERLSRHFGVPHPVLAQSYARQLINVPPFPAFMGYSSRFLAESWDSNNLYWARLADEKQYSPEALNVLVPELTRRMVEKIFATDVEDWPALLRAERETGDEFRQGKIAFLPRLTNEATASDAPASQNATGGGTENSGSLESKDVVGSPK